MESLMDNAIKFTEEGEIEFGYKWMAIQPLNFRQGYRNWDSGRSVQ